MEHIKSSLDALAQQMLRSMPEQERVIAAWRQVCGAQAGEHARATGFSAGKLTIAVDDAEWLATLSQMRRAYCVRLWQLTGVAVEDLDFRR